MNDMFSSFSLSLSGQSAPFSECSSSGERGEFSYDFDDILSPASQKVLQTGIETFKKISEEAYKYLKLGIKTLKSCLKAVVLIFSETGEKVSRIIAYLGLFSIVKSIFSIQSFFNRVKDFEYCIKIKDAEGIAWSSIEVLLKPVDFLSSLLSFGKAIDKLFGLTWITLFSVVTTPISVVFLCYETIKSIYSTIILGVEFSEMPTSAKGKRFRDYLEEKVGVTEEEIEALEKKIQKKYQIELVEKDKLLPPIALDILSSIEMQKEKDKKTDTPLKKAIKKELKREIVVLKDRKINRLRQHTDSKIVNYMLKTKKEIEKNPGKSHLEKQSLADLRKLMIRKLILNSGDSLFCLAEAVMFAASLAFPVMSTFIPFSFSLINTAYSIGKSFFKDFGMQQGLHNPQFCS